MIDIFITKSPKNKPLIDYLRERINEENTIFECSSKDLGFFLSTKHCDLVLSMECPHGTESDSRYDNIRAVMDYNKDIPVVHVLKGDDTTSTVVVRAFKLGATDCIRSPFSYEELYFRIMAILAKTRHKTAQRELTVGAYSLNPGYRSLRYDGPKAPKLIEIPTRECQILEMLFSNPDKILTRSDILKTCWGRVDNYTSRILSTYLGRVRKRIEGDPSLTIEVVRAEGIVLRTHQKDTQEGQLS